MASVYTYRGWTITGREGSFTAHKGGMFLDYRSTIAGICDRIDAVDPKHASVQP